jgi:hypothetical protein
MRHDEPDLSLRAARLRVAGEWPLEERGLICEELERGWGTWRRCVFLGSMDDVGWVGVLDGSDCVERDDLWAHIWLAGDESTGRVKWAEMEMDRRDACGLYLAESPCDEIWSMEIACTQELNVIARNLFLHAWNPTNYYLGYTPR